jgi:hypothetical protein
VIAGSVVRHEIYILVENFGLNRQPFFFNDIRNPRGILDVEIKDKCGKEGPIKHTSINVIKGSEKWSISGVDCRDFVHDQRSTQLMCQGAPEAADPAFKLHNAYGSSGLEDESDAGKGSSWSAYSGPLEVGTNAGVVWFKANFDVPSTYFNVADAKDVKLHTPLRLHMTGAVTAYAWVNGVLIARYYGNGDGPQSDFFIMDGIIARPGDNSGGNELKLMVYAWNQHKKLSPVEEEVAGFSCTVKPWTLSAKAATGARPEMSAQAWSGNLADNKEGARPFVLIKQTC